MQETKKKKSRRGHNLKPYQWPKGVSGNPNGAKKKEHTLRWYLEGAMLTMKIPPADYIPAMQYLRLEKKVRAAEQLMKGEGGLSATDPKILRLVPKFVKELSYGQFGALKAAYESGQDPELYLKIADQLYGKPIQPTTLGNPDGSPIKPAGNVLVVTVDETYEEGKS